MSEEPRGWTRPFGWLSRQTSRFRSQVRRTRFGRIVWRTLVTIVGTVVILIGIILVPLPGPGWVVILAGLGLLSTEYEWARRLLVAARRKVSEWTARARRRRGVVGQRPAPREQRE